MAKLAKRARLGKVDRISGLPDEILCHVMSFLPLKEAIRTSILSTRWSKVFTLMSNLNFEDCLKTQKSESFRFMNFVDRVLFYHTGVVDKLHLKCGEFIDSYRVDGWMRYALKNKVRELDLCLNCKDFRKLPLGVFTCKTLVSLRLDKHSKCKLALELPVKICFPSLKSLHLSGIGLPDDGSIQRFFSSCSVLEELVVDRCFLKKQCKFNVSSPTLKRLTISYTGGFYEDYEILIDAPSLVFFKCCYYLPKRFLLKNLNSLVKAYIDFGAVFNSYNTFVASNYIATTDLFKGISNVQSLHLTDIYAQLFLEGSSVMPELPKMTYLNLDGYFFVGRELVLPHLLASFPCLEALVLKVKLKKQFSSDINTVMSKYKRFPSFLWSQLKTLEILSFKGKKKKEQQMVKYFLKNAEVLENLTVQTLAKGMHLPANRMSKITKQLLNLPKVSKKCKVLVV
ncbi:F-box protein At4g22280-like [Durio zibethinus]|uniref:F-box protein At4g22280-like n=1 Tax=Durio zibethinus TaxID=66656 RepID=A0A6P5WQ03_DURZI|nr:F-box protein At4g22280-like [Durio zibethinus]